MTQSTEQERAEFEAWAEEYGLSAEPNYNQHTRADCWAAWQAARRAQVVPKDLIEAAQAVIERWDSPNWKDLPATADYIARLRNALAASPQPPEAAPVQMPEADAYMDAEDAHRVGTSSDWVVTGDKRAADDVALYTEHQVRQLLAKHGIK